MPVLSFSLFSPLKLFPAVSANILSNRFASYFSFIYEHLLKYWSSMINTVAVTALLLTSTLSHDQLGELFIRWHDLSGCSESTNVVQIERTWPIWFPISVCSQRVNIPKTRVDRFLTHSVSLVCAAEIFRSNRAHWKALHSSERPVAIENPFIHEVYVGGR